MRKLLPLSLFVVAVASTTGCYRHSIIDSNATAATVPAYDKWHHHLIYGLANLSGTVDAGAVCPNGVARVDTRITFVNGLVSALTASIYTPATVRVYCSAGRAEGPTEVELALTPEVLSANPEIVEAIAAQ